MPKHEITQIFTRKYTKFLVFISFIFVFFGVCGAANAATLYFSPSSGSYNVGQTFSVSVYVSSADQAMNAASGVISFPSDKLEVASLSKTGSIFSLWVQEPSFSNSAGTINFEGIVLNPGFVGTGGKIIGITFRPKTAGTANLSFTSGSVLANDGQGTNILTALGTASFAVGLTVPAAPEATTPGEAVGVPAAPQIFSPTHPDPNKWYAVKNAKFTWELPPGTTGARLLISKTPDALPTVTYVPPVDSKDVSDLDDGVWYFHVRLRNESGWGAVSHFRLQIDTEPPKPFEIKFVDGKETENPRPTVLFDTTDTLSGIDYYRVKIGEGDFFNLLPETVKSNPYTLPLQAPGKRTILVQAFDRAGNYAVATEEFVIKPLAPPVITEYPRELKEGEALIIKGTTYPNSEVRITLQAGGDGKAEYQETKSDSGGNFTLVWEKKLAAGIYKFHAEVTDSRGAKSYPSEDFVFAVKAERWLQVSYLVFNYLAILIALVVIVVSLLFLLWYLLWRFKRFRRKLRREVGEVESAVHKAFDILRDSVREEIRVLEKTRGRRELTQEEERIIKQLKRTLDSTEEFLRQEIEEIEREVK
jgi:hypothetical protein